MPEMLSKPEPTHYDHLMVARSASLEVIRAAYRTLTQKYHPDRNAGDAEATRLMQLINESYAVLCDPQKREEYDRRLAQEDAHKLALGLLVPALDWLRRRGRIAAIASALSVLVIAGLGVLHHRRAQLAHSTLHTLSARAGGMIQRHSSPESPRKLQTVSIERHDAPDSGSSASASSAAIRAGAESPESSSARHSLPERPAQLAAQPVGEPAKLAAESRARAPKPAARAPTPVAMDNDLAEVRSKDPVAAKHIFYYCRTVAKTAVDGGAACRHNESLAWKQFVLTSNHAQIYEEVRLRCPPKIYPDSYQGKEACVRHESGFRPRFQ